jgi:flagellar hook-associated protein 3 FlgL
LQAALESDDLVALERAAGLVTDAFDDVSFTRAALGARSQTLETISAHLTDERTELQRNLSDEIDVDFVQAISDLTARQAAFQASLQLSAMLQQQTLLNYL